ncbi:MAG: hypothetical protein OXB95_12415 [Rhodobacteraceae bacterium]|nr:hypothetical protein [Paracoccaceae bacterium]
MTTEPSRTGKTMDLKHILAKTSDLLNSGQLENEAQVKQYVLIPILRALGWDDANPQMVKPEYNVDQGRVDYALLDLGTPHVFMEAKRVGVALASGEEQLFGYAAHRGVPILILTDGRRWDFYLSMAPGVPNQRRFFRMDLSNRRDISENARLLERFVQRDRVVSGQSRQSAERVLESVRLRERARSAIPRVWSQFLQSADQRLIALISNEVVADCGSMPVLSDVRDFLNAQASSIVVPRKRGKKEPKTVLPDVIEPPHPILPPPVHPHKGRIVGFEFKGERYETTSGVRTLVRIVMLFDGMNPEFMPRLERRTTGPVRKLVSRERSELYRHAHRIEKNSIDLQNGWWLGSHLSYKQIRRHIKTACKIAGVEHGAELKLIERG